MYELIYSLKIMVFNTLLKSGADIGILGVGGFYIEPPEMGSSYKVVKKKIQKLSSEHNPCSMYGSGVI